MTPVRVLFLSANPSTTVRLSIDEEVNEIGRRLRNAGVADRFELRAQSDLRANELTAALLHHQPRIVHFSGHASKSGELFLSSGNGEAMLVSAEALRNLFKLLSKDILAVVLNACYSEVLASSLAEVLPVAVGMRQAITDRTAIDFAAGFYEALGFGKSIKTAFEFGLASTLLADSGANTEVPQLRARNGVDLDQLFLISEMRTQQIASAAVSTVASARPKADAAPGKAPTRPSMRKLLTAVLVRSEDLDNFCVDFFPKVFQRFGTGMGRIERESLLISLVKTPLLLAKLREHDEEAVAQNESLLKYD